MYILISLPVYFTYLSFKYKYFKNLLFCQFYNDIN